MIAAIRYLLVAAVFALAQSAMAAEFETKAPRAILIDAKSGTVYFEKAADELFPPASMSKLLTMVLVFEGLKAGTLKLDQEFVISEDAWKRGGSSSGGSTMYALVNSRVKLEDLMKGVVVQSANDAAIAIAEGMAGSEPAFAVKMSDRARELGLKLSTFRNATGLPDPGHRMNVRELAMVARYIISKFPDQYKLYGMPEFEWNKIKQRNRNPLLTDYPGADGMKTGFTDESGYGLVGSAVRNGRRLIMVIGGLKTAKERKDEAQKLLDWGFGQFKTVSIMARGDAVGTARVWGGVEGTVPLVTSGAVDIMLSPPEMKTAELRLEYNGPLIAPVQAGVKVGSVRVLINGEVILETPVETGANVAAEDSMWGRALDSVMIMVFGG